MLTYSWIKVSDVPLCILYVVLCIGTFIMNVFNPIGPSPCGVYWCISCKSTQHCPTWDTSMYIICKIAKRTSLNLFRQLQQNFFAVFYWIALYKINFCCCRWNTMVKEEYWASWMCMGLRCLNGMGLSSLLSIFAMRNSIKWWWKQPSRRSRKNMFVKALNGHPLSSSTTLWYVTS